MNHVPSWSIVESDYIDDYIDMLRNLDGEGGGLTTLYKIYLHVPYPQLHNHHTSYIHF